MKKRILSFFLALVMLFSCLSLNVFATVSTGTEATQEEENVSGKHTDAQITSLVQKFNYLQSTLGKYTLNQASSSNPTDQNKAGKITVQKKADGTYRFLYGAPNDLDGSGSTYDGISTSNSYVNHIAHQDSADRNLITVFDGYKAKGQSFVIQMDIEFTEKIYEVDKTDFSLFQPSTYLYDAGRDGNNLNALGNCAPYLLTVSISKGVYDGDGNLVTPGYLTLRGKSKGTYQNIMTLTTGVDYTIAIHVDPSVVDVENGIYGTYDVYVNGKCVANDFGFVTKTENDHMDFSDKATTPYFIDQAFSTYTNTSGKTTYYINDEATINAKGLNATTLAKTKKAYFFVNEEDLPKGDAFVEAMKAYGYYTTGNTYTTKDGGKITVGDQVSFFTPVAIGEARGVQDFCLGFVRFISTTGVTFSDTAFYFDNLMVYYTESGDTEYVDVTDHKFEAIDHTHNYDDANATITYKCVGCDASYTKPLDANGDRICDECVDVGGYMTPLELIEEVGIDNIVFTHDLTGLKAPATLTSSSTSTFHYGNNTSTFATSNPNGTLSMVTENGNTYIKYGNSQHETALYSDTNFFQVRQGTFASKQNMATRVKNKDPRVGASYVISYDFTCLDYKGFTGTLLEVMSYLRIDSSSNVIALNFISLDNTGELSYIDGEGASDRTVPTGKILTIGQSYRIAIHHNPKDNEFDLYLDGELIADNITALCGNSIDASQGELATSTENEMVRVDGETQFTPAMIRFKPMSKFVSYDVYAIDNINIYRSESYLECKHAWSSEHTHNANKLTHTCTICGKTATIAQVLDYSVLNGTGNSLTPEEVKATDLDKIIATEFAEGDKGGVKFTNGESDGALALGSDNNGNYYIEYRNPSLRDEDTSNDANLHNAYAQIQLFNDTRNDSINNINTTRGKSYTISLDFQLDGSFKQDGSIAFLQIMCYLKKGMTDKSSTSDDVVYFQPVTLNTDKSFDFIYYTDDGLTKKTKHYELETEKWYNLTVHHIPTAKGYGTFDLFINGECILNDVRALSNADNTDMTWSHPVATMPYGKTATLDDNGNVITNDKGEPLVAVRGTKDYVPTYIRFSQFKSRTAAALRLDNIKFYYTNTNIECTHECTTSNKCDLCGVTLEYNWCDCCGGHMLANGAAVSERSVTLGDKIGMNLYLTLSDKIIKTEGAAIAVSVEGKQTEEIPVSELTKDANGKYKVTALLRSIDMTRDVTVSIKGAEEFGTYTTNVHDYLRALDKVSSSDTEKALIVAMKNYGAYAQEYFAKKNNTQTGILANTDLLSYEKNVGKDENPAEDYEISINKDESALITVNGASLILSNETRMKFYFSADENATVTVDGNAAQVYYDEVYKDYYVIVSRSSPADLDIGFTIVITDESGTLTADVSILSALDAVFKYETNAEYLNLARAIYNYHAAAKAYVAN